MAQAASGRDVRFDPAGMKQFLPHSIAASLGVLGFPSAVLFSTLLLTEPNPPVLLCSLLSLVLSSVASMVGTRLWQKHPRSKDVSFGDLMFWSWWGRRRAEGRLARGTAALGLDRRGTPIGQLTLSRGEQLQVLRELNDALESKDPYTRGHSKRVERHVFRMANAMGLSVHEIEELRLAAALHDVGKIRVPDGILRKPSRLTAEEFDLMKDHPSVGAWMLSFVGSQDVIEGVRYHHERWDGRGYPDGLAATDIPLFARMISVADTYDAITSTRPYRAKAARDNAVKEIKAAAGSQLDPMCVEVFCASLPAPVPIAAVLYLLPAGIKRLMRELAVSSRRAGLQAIASGVGAASAAVIVTTPVVAPSLGARPASAERTVRSATAEGPEAAGENADQTAPEVADDAERDGEKLDDGSALENDPALAGRALDENGEPLPEASAPADLLDSTQEETSVGGSDPSGTDGSEDDLAGDDEASDDSGSDHGQGKSENAGSGKGKGNAGGNSDNGNSGDGNSDKGNSGTENPGKGNGEPGKDNGNGEPGKGNGNPDPGNGNSGGDPDTDPGNSGNGGNPDPGNGNSGNGGSGGNGNSGGNPDPGGGRNETGEPGGGSTKDKHGDPTE